MHVDLNDATINQDHNKVAATQKFQGMNQRDHDAYNVPFNMIVEGSYFGDNDCLYQKRCVRESMAEADKPSTLLTIKKVVLEDLLSSFSDIKTQMRNIAREKKRYYRRLVSELIKKRNA